MSEEGLISGGILDTANEKETARVISRMFL